MKTISKAILLSLALAGAGLSHAFGPGGMHGDKGPMQRMDSAKMEQHMSKRLDALKTALKLTPAQEADWARFTAAVKPQSDTTPPARPSREEMDKLTTPERMEKMRTVREQHHKDMSAAMERHEAAVKTFYATLTAEQKKVFDQQHARMDGGRGERKGPQHGKHHG